MKTGQNFTTTEDLQPLEEEEVDSITLRFPIPYFFTFAELPCGYDITYPVVDPAAAVQCPDPGYMVSLALFLARVYSPKARVRMVRCEGFDFSNTTNNTVLGLLAAGLADVSVHRAAYRPSRVARLGHVQPFPGNPRMFITRPSEDGSPPGLSFRTLCSKCQGYWVLLSVLMSGQFICSLLLNPCRHSPLLRVDRNRIPPMETIEDQQNGSRKIPSSTDSNAGKDQLSAMSLERSLGLRKRGYFKRLWRLIRLICNAFEGIIAAGLAGYVFSLLNTEYNDRYRGAYVKNRINNDRDLLQQLQSGRFQAITTSKNLLDFRLNPVNPKTGLDHRFNEVALWNPPILNRDDDYVYHQLINQSQAFGETSSSTTKGDPKILIWYNSQTRYLDLVHKYPELDYRTSDTPELGLDTIYTNPRLQPPLVMSMNLIQTYFRIDNRLQQLALIGKYHGGGGMERLDERGPKSGRHGEKGGPQQNSHHFPGSNTISTNRRFHISFDKLHGIFGIALFGLAVAAAAFAVEILFMAFGFWLTFFKNVTFDEN